MSLKPPPGWTVPATTIIIATTERSGSNYLGELIGQTERLGRPVEYFSWHVIRDVFKQQDLTLPEMCALARSKGATENGVVGIKMFPEHFPSRRDGFAFSEWFGAPRFVWLRRRDLIGQAISLELAKQRQAFTWKQQQARGDRKLHYSGAHIGYSMYDIARRNARWETYFQRIESDVLTLWYEDVEADPDAAVRAVAEHAGVELADFRAAPTQSHQKQRDAVNQEWRARFMAEQGDPDVFQIDRPASRPMQRRMQKLLERLGLRR